MNYRLLGTTALQVSEVGLGLWAIGGDAWGPVDDQASLAAIQRAWELGVNFFDTADVYGHGHSEELLGRFLKTVPRDQVLVATKVGLWRGNRPNPYNDPRLIIADCEASLKRLGTDFIDVYQKHVSWDENTDVFATAFRQLKEQGKVRCVGLSSNDLAAVRRFNQVIGGLDTLQLDYSLLNRQPEKETLPLCQQHGIGVIARGPLAMGKLTGKFTPASTFPDGDIRRGWLEGASRERFVHDLESVEQLRFLAEGRTLTQAALAYVLAQAAVSTTIPGAKNPEQVAENVQAVERPLRPDELVRIRKVLAPSNSLFARLVRWGRAALR
ncbi:MAG TPA: aldo/keto reductase [Chloroflexi bacterium]|nr:aldo/keto reductase [Chloroflexota bacterium]